MLNRIAPCISPELLMILSEMGHGDDILLADSHFPGNTMNSKVLRADGVSITALLDGILPLFELDSYTDPLAMMAAVEGDQLDPAVEENYLEVIRKHVPEVATPVRIERFSFYDRTGKASAVVMTGETAKYGNLLLKKGVTPVA